MDNDKRAAHKISMLLSTVLFTCLAAVAIALTVRLITWILGI